MSKTLSTLTGSTNTVLICDKCYRGNQWTGSRHKKGPSTATLHLSGSQLSGDIKSPQNPMRTQQRRLGAVKIHAEAHVLKVYTLTYKRGCKALPHYLFLFISRTNSVTNFPGIRIIRRNYWKLKMGTTAVKERWHPKMKHKNYITGELCG